MKSALNNGIQKHPRKYFWLICLQKQEQDEKSEIVVLISVKDLSMNLVSVSVVHRSLLFRNPIEVFLSNCS